MIRATCATLMLLFVLAPLPVAAATADDAYIAGYAAAVLERQFSLADVAYAPHLWLVAEGGFDLSPYPRVRDWLGRLTARPAWRKAADLIFGR